MLLRPCRTSRLKVASLCAVWLIVNAIALPNSWSGVAWATGCSYDALNNVTDCAVNQNVQCTTTCDDPCVNANGKWYTGSAHGTPVSGSKKQDPTSAMIDCWESYPCVLNTQLKKKCIVLAANGRKICDGGFPLVNCQYCEPGAITMNKIWNFKVIACGEE